MAGVMPRTHGEPTSSFQTGAQQQSNMTQVGTVRGPGLSSNSWTKNVAKALHAGTAWTPKNFDYSLLIKPLDMSECII